MVATDGALWTTALDDTGGGQLVRISTDGYHMVADVGGWPVAGPDGSVWVQQELHHQGRRVNAPGHFGDVARYWPDGRRDSIGRPVGVDPPIGDSGWGHAFEDAVCFHGVDPAGGVWVSEVS